MAKPPEGLDLAALDLLRLIREAGSFSAAAARLGVKQSTVSYRVERLRRALRDPLFVREGGETLQTPKCEAAIRTAERMAAEFADLVEGDAFDPATTEAGFAIACNVYERFVILPGLVGALRRKAPGLRLSILPALAEGRAALREGRADLLLGPEAPGHEAFRGRRLFSEGYVCAMDEAHPLADGGLTLEAYAKAAHVLVDYGGGWRSPYLEALKSLGVILEPRLTLPSIGVIGAVLDGTDLIATLPARFAATLGPAIRVLPAPFEARLELFMFWRPRDHAVRRHEWMRGEVEAAARAAA